MESRGPPRVKNKAAAPVQISAEQLLREAVDRQELPLQAPTARFSDLEELHEFQGRKRREYEDYVRRQRTSLKPWAQYAQFELEQKELARARSVFERALDVLPNSVPLWIKYIEAEIKNRNIAHARNLLDRAVTHLPRVDKLWYKYLYVEEMLGNVAGTRQIFDRWLKWEPAEEVWNAYIRLEKRYNEYERARDIFRSYTVVHPYPRTWIKWAKFEEEVGTSDRVREVFQTAVESLGDEYVDERLFISYARFEAKLNEYERARAIYKFGLDNLPRARSMLLHKEYTTFEKQFGDRAGIEDVVVSKRRRQYEEQVKANPKNYDAWFDWARLEETTGDHDRIRDVYEQAVAQVPPAPEKRLWRRYIFLWIFYALWEEVDAKNAARARQVYDTCLGLVPHKKFTFAKVWLQKAYFEIRQGELTAARKTLGRAIGMCPKDRLFKGYIELEKKLYEFQRCRTLYEKHILYNAANCSTWIEWAELERGLDDVDRARAIFEMGVGQPVLDMPEVLWKAYIDFEEEEGEYERTRALYERLLAKADHPKVWISYALFEAQPDGDGDGDGDGDADGNADAIAIAHALARARKVFERATANFRDKDLKTECVSLLNGWLAFERENGTPDDVAKVQKQMPRRTKKKRRLDDGSWEEYDDYVFPADDRQAKSQMDLLAIAQAWKKTGGTVAGGGGGAAR